MDSKILALLVTGVAAIVVIAFIVVYQFAEQQYAISKIDQQIQEQKTQEQQRKIQEQKDNRFNAFLDCLAMPHEPGACDKYK